MISSVYLFLIPIVFLIMSGMGILSVYKKPVVGICLIAISIILKNFFVIVGTRLDAWFVINAVFIALIFYSLIQQFQSKPTKVDVYFFIFIIYALLISIIGTLLLYWFDQQSVKIMIGGFLKNEGRIIVQSIFFLVTFCLIFTVAFFLKSKDDIEYLLRVITKVLCLTALLGLIQYTVVVFFGFQNPFPINTGDYSDGGHTGYISNLTFRVNSIVGEPKHFGLAMTLGMNILILSIMNRIKLVKYQTQWLALFVLMIFLTFSTTGYVLSIISIISCFIISGKINFKYLIAASFFILLAISIQYFLGSDTKEVVSSQFQKAGLEVQDLASLRFLISEPQYLIFGTGMGNIHHYAVEYLPKDFPLFRDTPFKGNSGFVMYLSDFGFVGIILLYMPVFILLFDYLKRKNVDRIDKVAMQLFFIFSLLFLFRYTELFFLLAGVSLAIRKRVWS